jgi:hypothetical protein
MAIGRYDTSPWSIVSPAPAYTIAHGKTFTVGAGPQPKPVVSVLIRHDYGDSGVPYMASKSTQLDGAKLTFDLHDKGHLTVLDDGKRIAEFAPGSWVDYQLTYQPDPEYPDGSDEAVYAARKAVDKALDAVTAAQTELGRQVKLNAATEGAK